MSLAGFVRGVGRRVKWEQRSYWRNPAAAGFTFAFPLMFLVVFTAINGNGEVRTGGTVVRFSQFFVPAIVGFGVISACYTNLAIGMVFRRQSGILKRTRGTPVPASVYLSGIVANSILLAVMLSAVTIAFGIIFYGVTFPGRYLGLLVAIGVASFSFGALGVAVANLAPNEDAAPAIVNFALFPVLFISGTFGPVTEGSTIDRIAGLLPVRHLNKLLFAVFNPDGRGTGIIATHVLVLLAWGAVALVIAVRRFRWEPRSAR